MKKFTSNLNAFFPIFNSIFIGFIVFLLLPNIVNGQENHNLIPLPQLYSSTKDEFKLNEKTGIICGENYEKEANYLANYLRAATNYPFNVRVVNFEESPNLLIKGNSILLLKESEASNNLWEKYKNDLTTDTDTTERYKLRSDKKQIKIMGTPKGVFWGVQTLLQLLPSNVYQNSSEVQSNDKVVSKDNRAVAEFEESVNGLTNEIDWSVPGVFIMDQPHFSWRGMLLDCSRHFMEKDFVKRYIDLLAYHKMNTLHWHITEDQGWRIEIKKYPKLTEVGAWRTQTAINSNGHETKKKYGGFYTQEDIKEIVQYAADRHIQVIPEIELPGHCQAALASYPNISCTGGPFEVETEWGVFREIYCAGNDRTFKFLENVLNEVVELFPADYVHIGGDEVPKYRWEHCDKCQARIEAENLKDEHELQSYFIKRIAQYLENKGKTLIGWDEILEGGLAEGAIVQSWRGFDGAIAAVKSGHQAIVSPTSHAYFDYDLKAIDLQKVYGFNPIPEGLESKEEKRVLGGECNMWSERAPQELVDSKVFPRILAMSEVLWYYPHAEQKRNDYSEFYQRVQSHYKRLNAMDVDYGFEATPVKMVRSNDKTKNGMKLIAGTPDLKLYYTLDGSIPNKNSILYKEDLVLEKSTLLKVQAYKNGEKYGELFERQYDNHSLIKNTPKLDKKYSEHYTGGGDTGLTNGWRGTLDFRDGNWQGYQLNDIVATFDLRKQEKEYSRVSVGFYQYNNSWIFLPTELSIEVSNDGKEYICISKIKNEVSPKKRGQFTHQLTADFNKQEINYLRVTAKNIGQCPDWHEASGSNAWLFVDEIILR